MTEVTFKNKKNRKTSAQDRAEPQSFTEYSWENLINDKMVSAARAQNRAAELKRAAAAKKNMERAAAERASAGRVGNGSYTYTRRAASAGMHNTGAVQTKASVKNKADVKTAAKKLERIRTKTVVGVHTVIAEKKYSFPLAVVLTALCFTVLIMAIVTASVQRSELSNENDALEKQYTALLSKKDELDLLLGTRDDLRIVEQVAKEELGMVKKDQVENFSLRVHNEDRIEIIADDADMDFGFVDDIKSFGLSVAERIKGFFGV